MLTPTPTQARYLSFIQAYTDGFGLPPAESEIALAMQVSAPSVNQMMKTLVKKGFILRTPETARSIEVLIPANQLPKWKGKIVSTKRVWMLAEPRKRPSGRTKPGGRSIEAVADAADGPVYCLKITLKMTRPPIWRRIETRDVTLDDLHDLIQKSMGWTNSHLHCFVIGGERYTSASMMDCCGGADPEDIDTAAVPLSKLASQYGTHLKFVYEYDFGDGWLHEIKLEKVKESQPGVSYPRCVGGARARPPEDIGGVWGFANFLEIITNPIHTDHAMYREMHGPFDPDEFDIESTTKTLQRCLSVW